MDKKFLCILLVASDGYRISLNNSRPLINRLPQIISALRQKWIIASLKQSAPSPLAIFPFFYLPPPLCQDEVWSIIFQWRFNPLSPNSDQHQFSPNNIHALSR